MERRYVVWPGYSTGIHENKTRCVASVAPTYPTVVPIKFQCSRKRGHGPGGEYCRQHAKKVAEGGR